MTLPRFEVAFVTQQELLGRLPSNSQGPATSGDTYLEKVLREDDLVTAELAAHDVRVTRVAWSDPSVAWASFAAVVLRTQPSFAPEILDGGELSVMVIGGECTHAVRKLAKPGDFRVHTEALTHAHKELSLRAMKAFAEDVLYGRVDMVQDAKGALRIMELELIEPELWFRLEPRAAQNFAEGLSHRLRS